MNDYVINMIGSEMWTKYASVKNKFSFSCFCQNQNPIFILLTEFVNWLQQKKNV